MSAQQQQQRQQQQRRLIKKGLFVKDLAPMMYGFGDENPALESIAVMEELCMQAHLISTNRGKIKVDDFRFALRRDPKKLARIDELLFMQEEIARARRGFDNPLDAYADEEDIAAAKADAAAGIGTVQGGVQSTTSGVLGTAAASTSTSAGGARAKKGASGGGLALPEGKSKSTKAKGKQKEKA
ncbi:transcription initiation factor TFIID subunit 13 [Rhodotorula toruloides]|uniref:Transcription initiation factor TFIID subunit 13 n=1 Tax=Rhodotorula toruloides TaxID=5286 RepID=A0A511KHQ9_RHOTO|nr:transcription initiation factor TFIID subunit 13 [Rhodotorula toruloides]